MSQLAVVYISLLMHAFEFILFSFFNFSFFDLFCGMQLLFEFEQCYGSAKNLLNSILPLVVSCLYQPISKCYNPDSGRLSSHFKCELNLHGNGIWIHG